MALEKACQGPLNWCDGTEELHYTATEKMSEDDGAGLSVNL